MDKDSNRREKRVAENQSSLSGFGLLLKLLDESHQRTVKAIDEKLESRRLSDHDRVSLITDKALLEITTVLAKLGIRTVGIIDKFGKRSSSVEKIVEEISERVNVDLPNIKSQIAELKENPIKETVRKYIDEFRKDWEEYKALCKKHFPDEKR